MSSALMVMPDATTVSRTGADLPLVAVFVARNVDDAPRRSELAGVRRVRRFCAN